jgi:hypothetical protein
MGHRGRLIHGVGSDRLPAICENSPQEELRGFEPLTPCMPCSFGLLRSRWSAAAGQLNNPLRVTVTVRYIPLMTAAYGT